MLVLSVSVLRSCACAQYFRIPDVTELGKSKSYIYRELHQKNLFPPFLSCSRICDHLGVSLSEFFDPNYHDPPLLGDTVNQLRKLDTPDLQLIHDVICRFVSSASRRSRIVRSHNEPSDCSIGRAGQCIKLFVNRFYLSGMTPGVFLFGLPIPPGMRVLDFYVLLCISD